MSYAAILPLAITMIMGPQIVASIVFVTTKNAVKVSVSYLFGFGLAICLGLAGFFAAARAFGLHADASGNPGTVGQGVQIAVVALLVFLAIRSYLNRKTTKTPKWLLGLERTKPAGAFKLGFLLVVLMPGDLFAMLAVAVHIAANGVHPSDITNALPFVGLALLLAAVPLLGYLAFRKRAVVVMPKAGKWMESHSWLVNIIIYLFFAVLILK